MTLEPKELQVLGPEQVDGMIKAGTEGRWLVWVAFVSHETEEGRDIDWYGRFCPTKKSVIGILRSMIDNTAPYKMIVIDTKALPVCMTTEDGQTPDENVQSALDEFFRFEEDK